MKTSLLIPTLERKDGFELLVSSARRTAKHEIEFLVGANTDDPTEYSLPCIRYEGLGSSQKVFELAKLATGDMLLMGSTDEEFLTKDWDEILYSRFPEDKLAVLYAKDAPGGHKKSCRPIISKEWYAVAGFYPCHFYHFYGDTWVTDIAQRVGRLTYVEDVVIEHYKKTRASQKNDPLYGRRGSVRKDIWQSTEPERDKIAQKVKALL